MPFEKRAVDVKVKYGMDEIRIVEIVGRENGSWIGRDSRGAYCVFKSNQVVKIKEDKEEEDSKTTD